MDSDLEQSRKLIVSSTKTLISHFQSLRGDNQSHDNTEVACREMENTQSMLSPTSSTSQSEENPLYGGPKTTFAALFRIPNILQRLHRQCKEWDANPPYEITPNSKFKVERVCSHLVGTSRFVDVISKTANDEDLKRLLDNLLATAPYMLHDISRVLKPLRHHHKLLVDQGLPCARNIQTKLEFLHRRKRTYQRWLKGRKVHFQ